MARLPRRSPRRRSTPLVALGAPAAPPSLDQLAAADGSEVEDLIREVSQIRLALDVDLTVAAAAAEAAADDEAMAGLPAEITTEALDAGHDELVRLRRRVRARADAAPVRARASRRLPLASTAPLVAVAVAIGLGGGAYASHLGRGPGAPENAADSSLAVMSSAVGQGNAAAAVAAGHQLQADVAALIGRASGDPAAAHDAATLLLAEQTVLAALPGAGGEELRGTMLAQAAQLQQVSGRSVATLATLPSAPTTRPLPLPSVRLQLPGVTRPNLPGVVRSVTGAVNGRPVPLASILPLASAVPTARATGAPATQSPTSAPAPTTAATASPSATPTPSSGTAEPTPGLLLPTAGTQSDGGGTGGTGGGLHLP